MEDSDTFNRLHSWRKEKIAKPISTIDDFVKHYREHNGEADNWANIDAQGQRETVFDKRDNSKTRKAVKGYWDGRYKDKGKSGCSVVIKGVDRERLVTGHGRSCWCVRARSSANACVLRTSIGVSTELSLNNDILYGIRAVQAM